MEISEPTISQAVTECVSQGARTVIIAPYFLSKGRHIQEDIPALVREAQVQHPDVDCIVAAPIGVDPLMAELIESRVAQAAGKPTP
jgi:sirohydrochlorin ferrochelatase